MGVKKYWHLYIHIYLKGKSIPLLILNKSPRLYLNDAWKDFIVESKLGISTDFTHIPYHAIEKIILVEDQTKLVEDQTNLPSATRCSLP